mmetsp:Transcript_59385/g.140239  ORF Transcript_59385/g.140239 Transcript_59385/m.140239 type:complete len:469 (+) Transcript_59385:1183-2589(+)
MASVLEHPGVLGPAALAAVHHQRSLLQGHPGQPARHHAHARPAQHKGSQVDVTRRHAALDKGRAGGQRQRRLCDVVARVGQQPGAEVLDLGCRGRRAHQHAVAARAVHLLHHQLGQMRQRVGQVVLLAADIGRHVLQDGLLAEVELHHLRHIGVDGLIVRDARADGVGQRHLAGLVGLHQARAAELRVGAEHLGVEKVVVDAAVDHVHPLSTTRGAHVHKAAVDEEVLPFHQFHAHLLREEGMLEVGRVVHAGRHDDHRRVGHAGRRDAAQRVQQQVRVMGHRRDAVVDEELGEEPHHHLAVFEHVAHAAGHAQVVLQHVVVAGTVGIASAHDVDAGDVAVDIARHVHAHHLLAELGVVQDLVGGHEAGLQDLLAVIDVVDEAVQRRHALGQAGLHRGPLGVGNHPRNQVEGDQAFGALAGVLVAIDREGDAHAAEDQLGLLAPLAHQRLGLIGQPAGIGRVVGTDRV